MDALENRVSTLEDRVTKHGDELDDLKLKNEHNSVLLAGIQATCNETRADLAKISDKLNSQGEKRWDLVVNTCITAIIAAFMGYIAYKVGLG